MVRSIYIYAARKALSVDGLRMQFRRRKAAHYVQRIPSWLTFLFTLPPFAFVVLWDYGVLSEVRRLCGALVGTRGSVQVPRGYRVADVAMQGDLPT